MKQSFVCTALLSPCQKKRFNILSTKMLPTLGSHVRLFVSIRSHFACSTFWIQEGSKELMALMVGIPQLEPCFCNIFFYFFTKAQGIIIKFIHFFFRSQYLRSAEFYEDGLCQRLVYLAALFFVFRMRLYFAWVLGECVCMSVGLGAYPAISRPAVGEGPSDLGALDR